jgi:hypothetical protein
MNAHERALELGAARFDFALSADEQDVVDRHLATCLQCRWDLDGMADDARRIESRPVARMASSRSGAVRAAIERPVPSFRPAMVLVAAALLALLAMAMAAVVGAELERRIEQTRLAVEPAPSGSAAPSPGTTAAVPVAWHLTSVGATPGIPFQASAVASSELGWIAVGERSCVRTGAERYDCAAPVVRSDDGRAWTRAGTLPLATAYVPVTSGPEPGIVDLAAGPDGYVAVGLARDGGAAPVMGVGDGAAWWSADGLTWERTLLDEGARPSTAFRAHDRWLIGGVIYRGVDLVNDRPIGAIWTSTDGRTWTRVEDDAAFDIGGYVDTMEDPGAGGVAAFAWDGETIVAVGRACAEAGLPCRMAAWRSGDGTAWERVTSLPSGDGMGGIVAVNGTFVATAHRCPATGDCATVVLHSQDGRAWEVVPAELALDAAMTVSDGTVVLVTGQYRSLDVRASADGATWTLLGAVPAPERVNWGAPVLVSRRDGGVNLTIRIDPLTEPDTDADVWTSLWEITPTP